MNVCFFCGVFNTNGGIGRVTSILANAMSYNTGFQVYLCSFYETKSEKYYASNRMIKKHELFSAPISMTKALILKGAIRKLYRYLRNNEIDVLVACGALYFPLSVIAAKKAGIKVICWEHIAPTVNTDYRFQKMARLYGTKNCDCNVVLTKSALKWYQENTRYKRIVQIYNPVDPVFSDGTHRDYYLHSNRIISVGRLSYQKNFDRLLDIAKNVLQKQPGWTWDIFGDGEEREKLNNKIKELGLEERVFLKGQVDDLYDHYNEYAFYVMTSRYEGFPMVLLEAASCGLPMISFDIETGPNEIIENGVNGFLIDVSSDIEMENAINMLIGDKELRKLMSNNSFKTAEKFEMNHILRQWISLLKKIEE